MPPIQLAVDGTVFSLRLGPVLQPMTAAGSSHSGPHYEDRTTRMIKPTSVVGAAGRQGDDS
jgi:hypothetical protein